MAGTFVAVSALPFFGPFAGALGLVLTTTGWVASGLGLTMAFHARRLRRQALPVDKVKAERFRALVREVCAEQGVQPPDRVLLLEGKAAQAEAACFGRLGAGSITATEAFVDLCTADEQRAVLRHEVSHYANADNRAFLFMGLPTYLFMVSTLTSAFFGFLEAVPELLLAWVGSHLGAMASARRVERRADRDAMGSPRQARDLRRALAKIHLHNRRLVVDWEHTRKRERAEKRHAVPEVETALTDEELMAEVWRRPRLVERAAMVLFTDHPSMSERLTACDAIATAGPRPERVPLPFRPARRATYNGASIAAGRSATKVQGSPGSTKRQAGSARRPRTAPSGSYGL